MKDPAARLIALDTCAVSDALDKLGLPSAVTGIQRLTTAHRIAGRILTVKLDRAEGRPPSDRHLGTAAIEAAQQGEIIVVEQRTGLDAAAWGGTLSLGARLRGVAGVIVEGPARDIDESEALEFPVFARSRTARTARGRIVEVATNTPIVVGEISVSAGDYGIADGTGVAFVAKGEIERVLEAAETIARRESAMGHALRNGQSIRQVMGGGYENMLKDEG